MRAASWEASTGALAAFLNSTTQVYMVDLYTITLSGGAVVRYTGADVYTTVNAAVYSKGPTIKRGATKLAVGIAVDTLTLSLAADASVTINGVALLPFIAAGGFDNARVQLDRAFTSAPGAAWVGTLNLFTGRVSDTQISRYEAQLNVASDAELLNVMIPRNVYQPGCSNTLFDGACGLAKATFATSITATGATDAARTAFATGSGAATNYYALGWLVGVAGANAGVGRTLKSNASGVFTVITPWPAAVASGDTFTAYPGCDKTQATCSTKFSNLARFRGQPYVPAPETVT